jgi:hypothetical protein
MRLNDRPTERTTAATDVLLSLAAAAGIVRLQALAPAVDWKLHLWSWLFALIALAAALGAVYHGLVLAERTRTWLWRILTVCLSMAISLLGVGVVLDAFGAAAAGRVLPILLLSGLLIYAVSRAFAGLFVVFIVYQALVLVLALGVYGGSAVQGGPAGAGWMAAGAAASLAAAAAQAARNLRVKLIWEFDHNGIFHLIQVCGVVLFGMGLSRG